MEICQLLRLLHASLGMQNCKKKWQENICEKFSKNWPLWQRISSSYFIYSFTYKKSAYFSRSVFRFTQKWDLEIHGLTEQKVTLVYSTNICLLRNSYKFGWTKVYYYCAVQKKIYNIYFTHISSVYLCRVHEWKQGLSVGPVH